MGLFPSIVASRVLLKTQFSPAAVFPSMDASLVEDSAVDGLSPWRLATFSSGSLSPDFICLLGTVELLLISPLQSRAELLSLLPSAVASGFVCFLSTVAFLLEDSVSQWFDTRYFTLSPAKSSVELLLSLHQSCSPQQSRIYFPTQWLIWVDIPVFATIFSSA